ncbi:helix-turn-helix transcriptional regulator [Sphingomonas sp. Root720]|uniref:helix-turn-helix transcriptional regulator n=1 Tax=Sphingomonas sp. Root720 TaxID=1736595 RepID=UPI001F15807D|nr:LuxR C-terminal-related transcriptional regulator [Sphingomonas sp. Root720]
MSGVEVEELLRFQQDIAGSRTVRDLQGRTLSYISEILHSKAAVFMLDPEQREAPDRRMVNQGLGDRAECLLSSEFRDNPLAIWARHMRRRWHQPVAVPSDILKRSDNTPFYAEFMRPLDVHHTMAIGLLNGQRYLGLIGVFRARHEPEFGAVELRKAALLACSIQTTLERNILEEDLSASRGVVSALGQVLENQGVVVTDTDFRVRYANLPAQQTLEKLMSPSERNHGDMSSLPAALLTPCRMSLGRLEEGASIQFELDVQRGGFRTKVKIDSMVDDPANLRRIIQFTASGSALSHVRKMRELGLTAREIDVAVAISSGLTNFQVADQLCISFYTVQSHLKSIYSKLNVSNRASLLNRVSGH